MQLLENWDPLSLPRGSVRALVTLGVLGVLWTQMLLDQPVRPEVAYVTLLIVGHYFGARSGAAAGRKPPLFLPRGTIRTLIVAGFAAVGYLLWRDGRVGWGLDDPAATVLFLAAALLVGFAVRKLADVVSRGKATTPRRWFENVKALVVIAAAVLLAFASFFGQGEALAQNVSLPAACVVGFYFGSRH